MTRKTHLGIAAMIIIPFLPSVGLKGGIGLLGASVPDWDLMVSGMHRGITHTLFFMIITTLFVGIFDIKVAFIYGIAYLSHLILDSLTKKGVPLFWPISKKYYGLKLIRTGSYEEWGLFILAICIFLMSF